MNTFVEHLAKAIGGGLVTLGLGWARGSSCRKMTAVECRRQTAVADHVAQLAFGRLTHIPRPGNRLHQNFGF